MSTNCQITNSLEHMKNMQRQMLILISIRLCAESSNCILYWVSPFKTQALIIFFSSNLYFAIAVLCGLQRLYPIDWSNWRCFSAVNMKNDVHRINPIPGLSPITSILPITSHQGTKKIQLSSDNSHPFLIRSNS